MTNKKVYRYEYINDFELESETEPSPGPYNADVYDESDEFDELKDKMTAKHKKETHPNIWDDFDNFNYDYFCGCTTIKGLRKWFDGFNKGLLNNNFTLVEYVVGARVIGRSRKQCIFDVNTIKKRTILK